MIESTNTVSNTSHSHQNNSMLSYEDIKWGQSANYIIHKKLGRGRYCHVFQATDKRNNKKVAIKVLLPIRKQKILREYQIMQSLYHPNICKIKDIVKQDNLQTTSLVLQLCPNQDFRELYPQLTLTEIKSCMKQVFQGLDYLHSMGIMHRDIKPFNIMINPQNKNVKIIDFGLSEFHHPESSYSDQVGSLYYRAPQLILGEDSYDYKIDCWAAGMILAGMIFKKTPFLQGKDPIDQLIKVMKLLGTKNIVHLIKERDLVNKNANQRQNICKDVISAYQSGQIIMASKSDYKEFINKDNKQNCTAEALDLIEKLICLDPVKRASSKDALNHPFFKK